MKEKTKPEHDRGGFNPTPQPAPKPQAGPSPPIISELDKDERGKREKKRKDKQGANENDGDAEGPRQHDEGQFRSWQHRQKICARNHPESGGNFDDLPSRSQTLS